MSEPVEAKSPLYVSVVARCTGSDLSVHSTLQLSVVIATKPVLRHGVAAQTHNFCFRHEHPVFEERYKREFWDGREKTLKRIEEEAGKDFREPALVWKDVLKLWEWIDQQKNREVIFVVGEQQTLDAIEWGFRCYAPRYTSQDKNRFHMPPHKDIQGNPRAVVNPYHMMMGFSSKMTKDIHYKLGLTGIVDTWAPDDALRNLKLLFLVEKEVDELNKVEADFGKFLGAKVSGRVVEFPDDPPIKHSSRIVGDRLHLHSVATIASSSSTTTGEVKSTSMHTEVAKAAMQCGHTIPVSIPLEIRNNRLSAANKADIIKAFGEPMIDDTDKKESRPELRQHEKLASVINDAFARKKANERRSQMSGDTDDDTAEVETPVNNMLNILNRESN